MEEEEDWREIARSNKPKAPGMVHNKAEGLKFVSKKVRDEIKATEGEKEQKEEEDRMRSVIERRKKFIEQRDKTSLRERSRSKEKDNRSKEEGFITIPEKEIESIRVEEA